VAEKVQIEITIAPDGTVHLETKGLKGQTCLAETEALEKALGKLVRREKTSEFYQQVAATSVNTRRK
jgi:hypothetical protein